MMVVLLFLAVADLSEAVRTSGVSFTIDLTTAVSVVTSAFTVLATSFAAVARMAINYMKERDKSERETFERVFKQVEKIDAERIADDRIMRQENIANHTAVLDIQEKSVTALGTMAQRLAELNGAIERDGGRLGKRGT